jgi:hypothetical protein
VKKYPLILQVMYLCHTRQGPLTCRKILRHQANGFMPPYKSLKFLFLLFNSISLILSLFYIAYSSVNLLHIISPLSFSFTTINVIWITGRAHFEVSNKQHLYFLKCCRLDGCKHNVVDTAGRSNAPNANSRHWTLFWSSYIHLSFSHLLP